MDARTVTEAVEPKARRQRAAISWSGGKDSCMALYECSRGSDLNIETLLATVNRDYGRVSMHGVRLELIERQASSLGLPLQLVQISANASNEEYERATEEAVADLKNRGIDSLVFGDLFLEDIRSYRISFLSRLGVKPFFPIWKRDTGAMLKNFISLGFKAIVVCVDSASLDESYAGRIIDDAFVSSLPRGVDPCGENGEFHTFVFDGPIFRTPIEFEVREKVVRDRFCYCDLIPC